MERLRERISLARKALNAFDEVLQIKDPTSIERVDDRNLTVHTYNEELSIEIFKKLPEYYKLLFDWMNRMEHKISTD